MPGEPLVLSGARMSQFLRVLPGREEHSLFLLFLLAHPVGVEEGSALCTQTPVRLLSKASLALFL